MQTLKMLNRDLIDYTRLRQAKGWLTFLDQAQAFDRVEHQYIFATLLAFGFPRQFVYIIMERYSDISSDLTINKEIVASFPLSRGVRDKGTLRQETGDLFPWGARPPVSADPALGAEGTESDAFL